eukprot:507074_1
MINTAKHKADEQDGEEKYTQQIKLKVKENNKHKSHQKAERKYESNNNLIELETFKSISLDGCYDSNLDKIKSITYHLNINQLENKVVVSNDDNYFNKSEIELQER